MPRTVAHADWSVRAAKRWVAVAERTPAGWDLVTVEPFGEVAARVASLHDRAGLLGVDVTLGLPAAFARAAAIDHFPTWLRSGIDLEAFAAPALVPREITLARPFYPRRPGGARHAHLTNALGATSMDDLRRRCERSPPLDRPACPLFWTLGANQVGRASVSAWQELLLPAGVHVWPFDGDVATLVARPGLTVAEAYPAACLTFLGLALPPSASKRRPSDRAALAGPLLAAAERLGAHPSPSVARSIESGFGSAPGGEDPFDAVVGLLGMLAVLAGDRSPGPPPDAPEARTVEGWVLGV